MGNRQLESRITLPEAQHLNPLSNRLRNMTSPCRFTTLLLLFIQPSQTYKTILRDGLGATKAKLIIFEARNIGVSMNRIIKTKLKFIVSLRVKHSKEGNRSICNRLAMEHFDKLTCHPDDTVLYVGCGSGDKAVILATKVQNIVGIDVDPAILKIATTDYPADNVEYLLDDLGDTSSNLTNWRESFSKVVSICRVRFYPKVPTVLRNMVGCLKPGGELLCIIPNNDFNFFGGAATVMEDHPEWGQRIKERNTTMWLQTEEQTEKFFNGICEWSQLSCKTQRFDISLSQERAKLMWLDCVDHVERVGVSHQEECLQALWQWAQGEYECNTDGSIKKPAEFMVIYGVKKC